MSNTHFSYDEIIERLCYNAGWITVIIVAVCVIFFFVAPVYAADTKINEITLTIKEDPKTAIEQILRQYVDSRPIGKAKVGTKE